MTKELFYITAILMLIVAIVILAVEVVMLRNENKDLLGRRDRKNKPKQQAESIDNIRIKKKVHQIGCNGICLTCYFKNNCSMIERNIFRDDTGQVADCWLYMKAIISGEGEQVGKTD